MYTSDILSKYACVDHGFFGKKCTGKNKVINNSLLLNQVHEDRSVVINHNSDTRHRADASITKTKGLSLAIKTADCVPIIMYNSKNHTIAAVHAGWKGTLLDIAGKTTRKISESKADAANIVVAFGPSIGPCCYDIEMTRANIFKKQFGQDSGVVAHIHGQYYLNLMWANVTNLLHVGVPKKNIDIPLFCTKCQTDKFYSYRAGDVLDSIQHRNISFIKLHS